MCNNSSLENRSFFYYLNCFHVGFSELPQGRIISSSVLCISFNFRSSAGFGLRNSVMISNGKQAAQVMKSTSNKGKKKKTKLYEIIKGDKL